MSYNFNTIDGLFKPNYNVYKPYSKITFSKSSITEPTTNTYKPQHIHKVKSIMHEIETKNPLSVEEINNNINNDSNNINNNSLNNENTTFSDYYNRLKEFIKKEEGFRSLAYKDGKYYSIGYGFNDPKYNKYDIMTLEDAEKELDRLLKSREAKYLKRFGIKWSNLTDNQKIALMSFGYNTGDGNILNGNVAKYLDKGDLEQVRNSLNINTSGGIYNPSLDARRRRERDLFNT